MPSFSIDTIVMNFKEGLPIQVRFNDIDVQGHVNNSVYFNYFDLGRLDYFGSIFGHDLDARENGVIIASTKTDYLKEVGLHDPIEVITKVVRLGNKSFDILQQVRNRETKSVHCESTTVMVCYNFLTHEPIPMSVEWKKAIIEFEKSLGEA